MTTAVAGMTAGAAGVRGPMEPLPHRVVDRREETGDVVTIALTPEDEAIGPILPGQFNMLTAYGIGEAAISVSSVPDAVGPLEHTIRAVGPVTAALCAATPGDVVGVRGPFGTTWGTDDEVTRNGDVVVVAGGIGIAPLRGAIDQLVHRTDRTGRVFVVVGARSPDQLIFGDDLQRWEEAGAAVFVTVDVAAPGWRGHVGVVTTLLATAGFESASASALVCGPEIMLRFTARSLADLGVDPGRIRVSLERNMQCGIGWCGHCQLGPLLLCRDGPVLPYAGRVEALLAERER